MNRFFRIFRRGSTTFYNSSKLFPKEIRDDISILYAFVRSADDFVDRIPAKKKEFLSFKREYFKAKTVGRSKNKIIDAYIKLEKRYEFDPSWAESFLVSMESDLTKKSYANIQETEKYIYGSANVIGLMMAKIMNLPQKSYKYAELLGKSFQFLNFIRDIQEDMTFGRIYFPNEDLKRFNLETLNEKEVTEKKKEFIAFIYYQLDRYYKWQKDAEKGFKYIPKKFIRAVKTASDMYKWTGNVISKDPMLIYRKKVKPTKLRIYSRAAVNIFGT